MKNRYINFLKQNNYIDDFEAFKEFIFTELNSHKQKNNKIKFDFRQALIDYGFDSSLVDEWLFIRKSKKGCNTETAFISFIKEVEKCTDNWTLNSLLAFIVSKSWCGFEWRWIVNETLKNNQNNNEQLRNIAQKLSYNRF